MAWGSLVNSMAVARFGSSLRVCERDGKACVRGRGVPLAEELEVVYAPDAE